MKKESYTIENISRKLNRISGIKVTKDTIKVTKNAVLGVKSLGKIDFLKRNGWTLVTVDSIKEIEVDKSFKNNFEEHRRKKKNNGIDTISGVKSAMKLSNFKIKK